MAENSDQILHFHEYFKIIRNRLWVIFTIFTLTVISGVAVTNYVLPKVYTASAQIQINPRGIIKTVGMDPRNNTDKNFDPIAFQAEFEIMQSPPVLTPVITNLQLDKIWAKRVFKSNQEAIPMQNALSYMSKILKIDFSRGTNIISINTQSEDPVEAAAIANAVADSYQAKREEEEKQRNDQGSQTLQEQIKQQQDLVNEKRVKVEKMRKQFFDEGVDLPNGAGTNFVERDEAELEARKKDLLSAQEDADARSVLLKNVIDLPDDQFIETLDGLNRTPSNISLLRVDAQKLNAEIKNLLDAGYQENHPKIQSLQAELKAKNDQVAELTQGQRNALKVDTAMAESRVKLLQDKVTELTKKVAEDTSSKLVPFNTAQRELEQQQSLLDAMNVHLTQAKTDQDLQLNPVRIISRAVPPEFPTKPNRALNYLVSAVAGLFVGIGVAFLIEYLDTSVKTMADAEMLLGLPVLTVIPNKGGPMPLVQDSGHLPHAEGYRILRAKLDLKVQNGMGPSVSMLSGGPGEGKSTTIYNLAVVCAQAGQSVILVDCDLRRPSLDELIGVSNERGLSNYLRGEGDAINFIQRTAIPKLHVLTAGNMPMSEIGVLAGDKIRAMLDDLKQRYDVVLIDSPPVLGISDGSIIAREVDYVILVIQHRRYPREISLRAKRAIEEVHGNCVGMVLNCVAVRSDDSYYYYSSYGSYYKKKTDRQKKRRDMAKANGKPVDVATRKPELESDEF